MSEDARRLHSPVRWNDTIPAARWPGGQPRFTIDVWFYLAAFRGELGHLIRVARRHASLVGDGKPRLVSQALTGATAAELWMTARAVRHYHERFEQARKGQPIHRDDVSWEFFVGAAGLAEHLADAMRARSHVDFANAFTALGMLEFCEVVLEVCPPVTFDFSVPPIPADAIPTDTDGPEPEPAADATPTDGDGPRPATRTSPIKVDGIDFSAVVTALRLNGKSKPKQAALVEYMSDKDEATVEDVAEHVHDRAETPDKTIRSNADATNISLEGVEPRLRFVVKAGRVFRMIVPE